MLPKSLRLPYQEATLLKKIGVRTCIGSIELTYQKNSDTSWRFLITIPKHVIKLSTGRNRLKRVIREYIRSHAPQMVGGGEMIISMIRCKPEKETIQDLVNTLTGVTQ